jgi:hypothetical protein
VPGRAGSRIAATGGAGEWGSQNAQHFGGTARPRCGPIRHGTVGCLKRQTGFRKPGPGLKSYRSVRADDNPDRKRSPPRKPDWLMCGQLMEELCVLFLQPIEYGARCVVGREVAAA